MVRRGWLRFWVGVALLGAALICFVGRMAPGQSASQAALVQTTGDVEVRILYGSTEIVLPVGTNFVFSRQADGRVVLRFAHRALSGPIAGRPTVP